MGNFTQRKTPELVAEVQKLVAENVPRREIERRTGVPRTTIALWLAPVDADGRTKRNRTRQDLRNKKYHSDPLYRIKQLLRVARAKAEREGYAACSSSPEEILATLTDTCECCGRHQSVCGTLCLDHWHTPPAKFRAWLCHDCNRAIGLLQDDVTVLKKAIELLTTRTNHATT